ncbi:ABC transporter permease [Thalassiella azotivora]
MTASATSAPSETAVPTVVRVVTTVAGLTLREATRRRVLWALVALTSLLLVLSGWGFSRLAAEAGQAELTSGQGRFVAAQLLNLAMFGLSLIAALGTAFLAGPTLSGETESGIALSVLARPVRRWSVLLGKWLGLVAFGTGFVVVAGLSQFLVVLVTMDYWPPQPVVGLLLLAAQTTVLLTIAVLLSTVVSPMASGVVAVGIFGATWIAGVVGGIGQALGHDGVAQVGTVSRMVVPTDGLWRGAMYAFQDSTLLARFGPEMEGFPFLGFSPLTAGYLLWCALWVAMVWGVAAIAFSRKDL